MFRFFVYINLILVHVFCQTTEDNLQFSTDFLSTQSWQQDTTEESLKLSTNIDVSQMNTEEPLETSTENMITQIWQDFTTEKTFEQENLTATIEQMTSTVSTTSNTTCPSVITDEMLEEIKRDIIEAVLRNISSELTSRLEEMEERLSALNCSNNTTNNNSTTPAIQLSWQIYENLQIPLTGWLLVFDQPYSHKTRIDDLIQIAGICHNEILVGATYNGLISLAAVGPASVLTLNTLWNQPQQFGQVYWYCNSGKSFGFSPNFTIRQTSADNQDLDSPLRLSWLLDQNMGGYRAGITRSLADSSIWHKIIYCN
jgi:hypothetical protein